jgi:DnaJ-class molecular chaperone
MNIREKCHTCHGDGWTEWMEQVSEYDWEPRQDICVACNGSGYNEVRVDPKTGLPI